MLRGLVAVDKCKVVPPDLSGNFEIVKHSGEIIVRQSVSRPVYKENAQVVRAVRLKSPC